MKDVSVVWHPYPKEKPKEENNYLVTIKIRMDIFVKDVFYIKDKKEEGFLGIDDYITAWAELPEPYKEEL